MAQQSLEYRFVWVHVIIKVIEQHSRGEKKEKEKKRTVYF